MLAESRYGDRVGERIGRLTFAAIAPERADSNRVMGLFKCDCGTVAKLPAGRVLNGQARTHCGCLTDHGVHRTHGMRGSPEYMSWQAMKSRCLDPNSKDYPRWGGRGITIHPEWVKSFEAFYAALGPRPADTTLDRVDTNGAYEPGNVRWATSTQQAQNRRGVFTVEIDGVRYPSVDAAAAAHRVSNMTIQRWCEGYTDPRRPQHGFKPPRANCRKWRTYAD